MPCVLGGLADDSEIVREVAMRAGQTIVNEYYTSAVDVLVPSLEEGSLHSPFLSLLLALHLPSFLWNNTSD
jgi:hypothetical protein